MSLNFTISIPTEFQRSLNPASGPSSVANIDVSTVSNWLRKFSNQFSPFENVLKNGLYSVLEKKIKEITPLLEEGQSLLSSQSPYSGVISLVNDLVRPRLAQLQAASVNAKKKIADSPEEVAEDKRLEKLWGIFNLPSSVLESHADCARFLKESNLGRDIVGYRETGGNDHDLKLDPADGHPLLKMQGQWTRWETVSRTVYYDDEAKQIKSRNNANQYWNYYHPDGLVPGNRFDIPRRFPIFQVTPEQHHKVLEHAREFYKTNPERDIGIPKDCVIQFFSSPRRESLIPGFSPFWKKVINNPLLDNLHRNIPTHVGVRLFFPDGKVYSVGVHMAPDQQEQLLSNFFSNYLKTGDAKIPMLDYEEYRQHEGRMVTSIPLTSERAMKILDRVDDLNSKQMRLQYMRQNCSQFVLEAVQLAGYDVDTRTTGLDVLASSLPSLNQIPLVAKVCSATEKLWKNLPALITKPIEFTAYVISYVPRKIGIILTNLLALKMGGAKQTTPLQQGLEDEEFYDKRQIQSFSKLIRSWKDIFKEETNAVYHTKYFLDWQKEQKSTFIEPYSGRPKLTLIPTTA